MIDKKVLVFLMVGLVGSQVALAESKPLSCVVDEVGGLEWKNNRWESTLFELDIQRFILVLSGNTLEPMSVARALDEEISKEEKNFYPKCFRNKTFGTIQCASGLVLGSMLYFNPKTMRGALSEVFGAGQDRFSEPDSLTITAFTCRPL